MKILIDITEDTYISVCNESMLPSNVKNVVDGIKSGQLLTDLTNGDMIKAIFPNMEIIDDNITVKIRLDPTRSNTIITTNYNWLGAPYRREV